MEAFEHLEAKKNVRRPYIFLKKEIYFVYMWTPTESKKLLISSPRITHLCLQNCPKLHDPPPARLCGCHK